MRFSSLLPPCGARGPNLGGQIWLKASALLHIPGLRSEHLCPLQQVMALDGRVLGRTGHKVCDLGNENSILVTRALGEASHSCHSAGTVGTAIQDPGCDPHPKPSHPGPVSWLLDSRNLSSESLPPPSHPGFSQQNRWRPQVCGWPLGGSVLTSANSFFLLESPKVSLKTCISCQLEANFQDLV